MTAITTTEAGNTGRFINLGTPASQNNIGAQTIIVYCKPSAPGTAIMYAIAKGDNAGTGLRLVGFTDAQTSLGHGSTAVPDATPYVVSGTAYTSGVWQHWQADWGGGISAATMNVYIDATNVSSGRVNGGGAIVSDTANDLFLLNRVGLGREFIGDVGYIARWNRVLTSTERTTVRTNGPLDVPSGLILCWANQQDYSTNAITPTARSTFVAGSTPPNTALGGSADTTAPILTVPTGTATGATTASGGVTTDEGNGTLYALASINATETAATVKASPLTQAITAPGAKTVSFTGLTASTTYYAHYVHQDAAGNDSAVANSASFTTSAAGAVVKGARVTLYNAATLQASLTGIRALWWDVTDPTGSPVYTTATAATTAAGVLTLDLNATTTLAVGASGFMLLYKLNATNHQDSLVFAGRVAISNVA